MGNEDSKLEKIRAALSPHGILLRGVLNFDGDGPEMKASRARTVVLLGNIGSSIWPAFSDWHRRHPESADPLDTWSIAIIRPVAEELQGHAWFPSERPWQPFQQWAMRAEGLKPSPTGILAHPIYGLWHGYRGAIGFVEQIDAPRTETSTHPCDQCPDKPCLRTCPVGAITPDCFDVVGCRSYLRGEGGDSCLRTGCIARNSCPVGAEYRYSLDQLRFHMDALKR